MASTRKIFEEFRGKYNNTIFKGAISLWNEAPEFLELFNIWEDFVELHHPPPLVHLSHSPLSPAMSHFPSLGRQTNSSYYRVVIEFVNPELRASTFIPFRFRSAHSKHCKYRVVELVGAGFLTNSRLGKMPRGKVSQVHANRISDILPVLKMTVENQRLI